MRSSSRFSPALRLSMAALVLMGVSQVQASSPDGGVSYYNAGVDLGSGFVNTTPPTQTFVPPSANTAGGYNAAPLTNKHAAVAITGTVSLIPEPDTDAMLLAGLGVCGLLVLRASPRRDR